ncbi:hypothetical protein PoB_007615600 [Plakobranchus ocellatus]|uniref:Uncharacterized protein n=1 Tax=Plakobranchus ocellatus TaxID=259542 RepID=A0AAV4E0M7_9GAST|nr:hypothetical protein PoB_007615600 [Plakobranchus ocellatus]
MHGEDSRGWTRRTSLGWWMGKVELGQENTGEGDFHNKVISGFQAFRQARGMVSGLESATERSLQISQRTFLATLATDAPLEKMRHA